MDCFCGSCYWLILLDCCIAYRSTLAKSPQFELHNKSMKERWSFAYRNFGSDGFRNLKIVTIAKSTIRWLRYQLRVDNVLSIFQKKTLYSETEL